MAFRVGWTTAGTQGLWAPARTVGVASPPVTDYETEGLLEGLDGEARAAREALLADLEGRGVGLTELRRAVEEERLIFLVGELLVGGVPRYTGREIAERTGMPAEDLVAVRRAHGLPVPHPDETAYTETDLKSACSARAFRDAGLEVSEMVDITRILGRGFAQAAQAMRALVLERVLEPGSSEHDLALRYAKEVARLMPLTEAMLGPMLMTHLRHMLSTEAINAAERESGRLPGARDINVAFADLVGFTRVGAEVPADELGRIAGRLAEMTGDLVAPTVRLVKTIGDAAMLVCPTPQPLLQTAFELIDAADAEGEEFPQLRVGMACGAALSRAGDWYGHPVNVASRVTDLAWPGSVLVTSEVHDAAQEGYRWSFAGSRRLRGVREGVPLYRARRTPPDGSHPDQRSG